MRHSSHSRFSRTASLTTAAALLLLAAGSASAAEWQIDGSHSTVGFSVKHMMVSNVKGNFEKVSGTVSIDDANIAASKVEVAIDAASINTRTEKRDQHLRSPDFFDAARYPQLTFKSTRVERAGRGKYKVTGDLTIRGTTRPVVLLVSSLSPATKSPFGTVVRGVSATGKINRKDFGLTWNKALETGGVVVGEDVELQIDAELVQNPRS
jgi:polyisoprenoid-binding protein YceI